MYKVRETYIEHLTYEKTLLKTWNPQKNHLIVSYKEETELDKIGPNENRTMGT